MTFVATAEAVVHAGATPVLADVDADTLLLTSDQVEPVLSPRTKAVVPVHMFGHVVPPADMHRWRDRGLIVLEDAAQAHLGHRDGIGVGHSGHAACFSFYPGKNLGALGDGGAVASLNDGVVAEVRRLRNHGSVTKYDHQVVGFCSRLDGLQAAMLRVKLEHLVGVDGRPTGARPSVPRAAPARRRSSRPVAARRRPPSRGDPRRGRGARRRAC